MNEEILKDDLNNYDVSWVDFTAQKASDYLDFIFGISDLERQNFTREFQIQGFEANSKILKPDLSGYELEAKKLSTIQAYQSKGFQITDITPGNLSIVDYACAMRASWLFDGVNFMPDHDRYLTTNFRSVDIQSPGNFLKIEFIGEINNFSNLSGEPGPLYRERASLKYQSVFNDSPAPKGLNLVQRNSSSGPIPQDVYHYDNYSRGVVWVSFNSTDQKPHLVRDGDVFNTYFDTITIHCNIGAPKIRVTIGNNSTIISPDTDSQINSQLHLAGGARLIKKLDQVMQPFCITDATATGKSVQGTNFYNITSGIRSVFSLVDVPSDFFTTNFEYISSGYSVFWITKLRFRYTTNTDLDITSYLTAKFIIACGIPGVDAFAYRKLVASCSPKITGKASDEVELDFSQPLRVVIPPQSTFCLEIISQNLPSSPIVFTPIYEIYGYSLGGIIPIYFVNGTFSNLATTKFITDSSFLDDFTTQYNLNT